MILGAANKINIITNLDLCLIPVPKFPTPTPNIIININKKLYCF